MQGRPAGDRSAEAGQAVAEQTAQVHRPEVRAAEGDVARVAREVDALFSARQPVFVRANAEIKAATMAVFERTFTITGDCGARPVSASPA